MNGPRYTTIKPAPAVTITVDGRAVQALSGRNLLAALLVSGTARRAEDFACAIGQCQRCLVLVDGEPRLACMTYPQGGETVSTETGDRRPVPWNV